MEPKRTPKPDIRPKDGIVLFNGDRMLVESQPFNMGDPLLGDDWRVAAWTEDGMYRFPIQFIAIVEVWREGKRVDKEPQLVQMELGI